MCAGLPWAAGKPGRQAALRAILAPLGSAFSLLPAEGKRLPQEVNKREFFWGKAQQRGEILKQ